VAGPIERANHLLPQIKENRFFDNQKAISGLRQILWGLFKKVVIADQSAGIVDNVFGNYTEFNSITLFTGAVLFAFQIYCDFSGYSDIALGSARLLGFELLKNFSFPYFSRDIAEFWRRWHISLSSWFRDYVYIPLGGSKVSKAKQIRNTFVIFLLSGFWHGANWTFIFWGLLNALYFLPLLVTNKNRKNLDIIRGGHAQLLFKDILGMVTTFLLVVIAWVFFRSDSVKDAFMYLYNIVQLNTEKGLQVSIGLVSPFILLMLFSEWKGRLGNFALDHIDRIPKIARVTFYYLLIICIVTFSDKSEGFIYFQF
jgi:D-alanyl-lipoteichoic acid acyltransferase DltB (MBOAT superfamily)